MSKDKLKEEFKRLPKKDQKELIQEYMTHGNFSTDDEDHEIHYSTNINKEVLIGDKYGNTKLSLAIEEGNIQQVRYMYKVTEDLTNAELLKRIAIDMMNSSVQEHYNLTQDVFSRVYSEAKYQLDLLGEDTTEVIDAYNLD